MILIINSNYCVTLNSINWLAFVRKKHCVFCRADTQLLYVIQTNSISRPKTQYSQVTKDENQSTEKKWTSHRQFGNRAFQNTTIELNRHGTKSRSIDVCSFISCPGMISSWKATNGCHRHSTFHLTLVSQVSQCCLFNCMCDTASGGKTVKEVLVAWRYYYRFALINWWGKEGMKEETHI